MNWNAYNEAEDLPSQSRVYRCRFRACQKVIYADKIYRTRQNRAWCKQRGIRLSGIGPGRPPKDQKLRQQNTQIAKMQMNVSVSLFKVSLDRPKDVLA